MFSQWLFTSFMPVSFDVQSCCQPQPQSTCRSPADSGKHWHSRGSPPTSYRCDRGRIWPMRSRTPCSEVCLARGSIRIPIPLIKVCRALYVEAASPGDGDEIMGEALMPFNRIDSAPKPAVYFAPVGSSPRRRRPGRGAKPASIDYSTGHPDPVPSRKTATTDTIPTGSARFARMSDVQDPFALSCG